MTHPAPSRASDSPDVSLGETAAVRRSASRDPETPVPIRQGELTLRLYTYLRDGRWYAEAPRLSLMAEGASEDEAVRCLMEQTVAYVRTVLTRGWFDRLDRPVTFRHRASLWLRVALGKMRLQSAHRRNRLIHI
jgi:hypothetical protein